MSENDALRLAVRHSCWANLELLAFCATLPAEQLAWTTLGSYGAIQQTLQHIVGAEQGYLFALTGEMPPRGMFKPDTLARLDELAEREHSVLERCERLLAGAFDAARVTSRPNRPSATAGVVIAQLVHHGSDHRARTSARSWARMASSRPTSTCGPTAARSARSGTSRSRRRGRSSRSPRRPGCASRPAASDTPSARARR